MIFSCACFDVFGYLLTVTALKTKSLEENGKGSTREQTGLSCTVFSVDRSSCLLGAYLLRCRSSKLRLQVYRKCMLLSTLSSRGV